MGDVLHALPVASALKAHWPDARLSWLIDPRWEPLLEGNPDIDHRIPFPREEFRGFRGTLRGVRWALGLRHLRADLAIDLQCLLRSALIARIAGSARVVGLADAREGAGRFYHLVANVEPSEHAVLRYLRILDALHVPRPIKPAFPLPAGDPVDGLRTSPPFVLFHPFARGDGKSLTKGQIRRFCESFIAAPILLVGVGELPRRLPSHVGSLLNRTTLPQLIWLIRRAGFVVSVDSGPMHIAAALDRPLLSIHTWSDPRLVGPFNESAWVWQNRKIRRQSLTSDTPPASDRQLRNRDLEPVAEWLTSYLSEQEISSLDFSP
jgi:heptosyltransferase-1